MRTWIIFLVFFSAPCVAESYLCTSQEETGFSYSPKTESWEQNVFRGNQFLLKPLEREDHNDVEEYGVYETGKGTLLFRCQRWIADVGVAHCGNENYYHFKFGRTSDDRGRFISADLGVLYIFGNQASAPRIGIGECIKL
jgi:hypothetical protein